jgi:hypothetical protein
VGKAVGCDVGVVGADDSVGNGDGWTVWVGASLKIGDGVGGREGKADGAREGMIVGRALGSGYGA